MTGRSSVGFTLGVEEVAERRLTSQGLERKQQLIDCAAALFAERGYADTRIKDIVEAAGVAKGLFYWYFPTKEELFRELAVNIRHRLRAHQAAAMDTDAGPLTQIRQGIAASVTFMSEHAHFFSLLEVESSAPDFVDTLRQGTAQHVADVRRLIEAGQAEGSIVDEDPDLLAINVVGSVGLFSHYHRTGRIALPIDELGRFVADTVVRSLAADRPAPPDVPVN